MIYPFKKWTPKLGVNTWIAPSADVVGNVTMGKECSIWFGCVVRGDVHYISIGDRTNIQDLSMIHVTHYKKEDMSDGNPTIIGSDVTIGHRVMMHGCTIENTCLIGMSATILDGAVIWKRVHRRSRFPRHKEQGLPTAITDHGQSCQSRTRT